MTDKNEFELEESSSKPTTTNFQTLKQEITNSVPQPDDFRTEPVPDYSKLIPALCNQQKQPEIQQPQPDDIDDAFQCSVCLGPLQFPVSMPCGHATCYTCIKSWITQSNAPTCPVCQTPFELTELRNVFIGKQEGEDPRPKDIRKDIENEMKRRQRDEQNGFNAGGMQANGMNQFNVQMGPFGLNFRVAGLNIPMMQQPQRERRILTKKEKIQRLLYNIGLIVFVFILLVLQYKSAYQEEQGQPKKYNKVVFYGF
ncbi:C3HC4 type (RING finger) domain-containing protein [Hexamita inflata]|uniref:RING-type E3 ubiquitin transferase n=1 Tax=Hexamita inflata TaxID=28002 RepID=A0AA86NDG3_9EUKA|nr:C3HC4 type (RING finger) domain-containing protein [Hexamita inflata]